MSRTSRTTLLAAATALLGTVALAAPAHAEGASRRDGAGDVWREVDGAYVQAQRTANVDGRRFRIEHRRSTVAVRATFGSLTRSDDTSLVLVELRTGTGDKYVVTLGAGPGFRSGAGVVRDEAGVDQACRGLSVRVDYADDTVAGTVPRSCVGRPAAFGWKAYTALVSESDDVFYDSVNSDRAFDPDFEPRLGRA